MKMGLSKIVFGLFASSYLLACGAISQDYRDYTQTAPPPFEDDNGGSSVPDPTPTPAPGTQAQFIASCFDCSQGQGNCNENSDKIDICRTYITLESVSASEISKMAEVIRQECDSDPDLRSTYVFSQTVECKNMAHVIDKSLSDSDKLDELTCQEDVVIDILMPDRSVAVEELSYIAESQGSLEFEKNGGLCSIVIDD